MEVKRAAVEKVGDRRDDECPELWHRERLPRSSVRERAQRATLPSWRRRAAGGAATGEWHADVGGWWVGRLLTAHLGQRDVRIVVVVVMVVAVDCVVLVQMVQHCDHLPCASNRQLAAGKRVLVVEHLVDCVPHLPGNARNARNACNDACNVDCVPHLLAAMRSA